MRPLILHWKVSLGLLAVVIAAVSLGSALHSDRTMPRGSVQYFAPKPHVGGWTGYVPHGTPPPMHCTVVKGAPSCFGMSLGKARWSRAERQAVCASLRKALSRGKRDPSGGRSDIRCEIRSLRRTRG